jgi:hypothetical protein
VTMFFTLTFPLLACLSSDFFFSESTCCLHFPLCVVGVCRFGSDCRTLVSVPSLALPTPDLSLQLFLRVAALLLWLLSVFLLHGSLLLYQFLQSFHILPHQFRLRLNPMWFHRFLLCH